MSSRLKIVVVGVSTLLVAVLLMGAVLGKGGSNNGAYRELAVYTEVLSRIKSDYVEEPDLKSVTLGALNGLLESLDPFASYLNAEQYKEYLKSKDAEKGNVGLILSKRFGYVGVVDAIPGSPAANAGLITNDMVESIRGIATRDMPLAYAYMLLQGKPGTTVEVSILQIQHPEPKKILLTRAVIAYPRATGKMLPDQIGIVAVQAMEQGTSIEVANAVKGLEKQGAKRLLLDLRHCGAGVPEEGIKVANLFQDKGLLSYLQGQRVPRQNFEADPAKSITKLPLVVMVNRGTASGAEVAAASLLDNKRAEVVGERTYGDASVRQPVSMEDGGAIILSVAKYYSPSGKAIQDTAVTPSVLVVEGETAESESAEGEEEAPEVAAPAPVKPNDDPTLQKAIEVLTKGVKETAKDAGPADAGSTKGGQMTPLNVPKNPNR
jgi:carboxyl-terminal processing protease